MTKEKRNTELELESKREHKGKENALRNKYHPINLSAKGQKQHIWLNRQLMMLREKIQGNRGREIQPEFAMETDKPESCSFHISTRVVSVHIYCCGGHSRHMFFFLLGQVVHFRIPFLLLLLPGFFYFPTSIAGF